MLERNAARTKVIATLGPACGSEARIREMIRAGADAFRLNMSHGDDATRRLWAQRVHRARQRLRRPIALIVDLRGPRLRLGAMGEPRRLRRGEELWLTGRARARSGELAVDYRRLGSDVEPGHRILLRDGRAELVVVEVDGQRVRCRVRRGAEVSSHQGLNLPDSEVTAPVLSAKDRADIAFAAEIGADWVALSFVRTAKDLATLRRAMGRVDYDAPIIAKIEAPSAVDHLEEILGSADGVMVARGDLAVELGHEIVPLVQKRIIAEGQRHGVPVITATQMLESMIESPQPTRAEVSDVANAVIDGTDSVMLSGETAIGEHPLEAVRIMNRIASKTEATFFEGLGRHRIRERRRQGGRAPTPVEVAAVQAAVGAAEQSGARLILAFTETGRSARLVSSFRSRQPIIGLTSDRRSFHRMALYWGVHPAWMRRVRSVDQMYHQAAGTLAEVSWLRPDHLIVALTGTFSVSGATNTLRLLPLSHLSTAAEATAPEQ